MMKSLFSILLRSSIIKYGLVGVLGLLVDMGLFYLFHEVMAINYLVANILSSSIAVIHNFILNSFFTFKVKDRMLLRFVSFYLIALAGMALSSGLLALLIGGMHLNAMVSKFISVMVVAVIQYFVNKKLTFGERKLFSFMNRTEKH